VTRDPEHRERHFLQEMNHPDLGVAEYAGPPYRLSKTPATIRRRTPRLGEHATEILAEWLGMPPAESQAYAWPPPPPPSAETGPDRGTHRASRPAGELTDAGQRYLPGRAAR
jgi:CoA-transferase family III